MRHLLTIIIIAFAVCACQRTPEGIIPPGKMAPLLADMQMGEAVVENSSNRFNNDSVRRLLKQSIYAKHGYTTEQVDTSLYWYGAHLELYMEVCDEAEELLKKRIYEAERRGAKAENARLEVSQDGDSVNLWTAPPMLRNYKGNPTEYITFSIPRDKNWEQGDRYTLSVKGIMTGSPIAMQIVADYTDGSTEYVSARRNSEQTERLTLVLDSMKTAQSVYGFVRYTPREGEVSYLDSLSLVRTRGHNDNKAARANQHHTRHR